MKKKTPNQFSKFSQKKSNAAIKEQFKQEKRKIKKEREEFFDRKRNEVKEARKQGFGGKNWQSPADRRNSSVDRNPTAGRNAIQHSKQSASRGAQTPTSNSKLSTSNASMPLNKFIAHAGIAARRDAAEMVRKAMVKVNGELVTEPGHKISERDEVKVNGKKIYLAKNLVYILLNKPKDYITTTDDPQKKKDRT